MMRTDDLMAWLGPAAGELTPEQREQVAAAAREIDAYYPDPDEQREREVALSAVVQYLLGEMTTEEAGRKLVKARLREREARVAATWVGVMAVRSEGRKKATTAAEVGIDRMALLEALGERPRRRKAR